MFVDRFELRLVAAAAQLEQAHQPKQPGERSKQEEQSSEMEVFWSASLQRDERGLCVAVLNLPRKPVQQSQPGAAEAIPLSERSTYVAMGTGYCEAFGMDAPPRGRLLLYEVVVNTTDNANHGGQPLQQQQRLALKQVHERTEKGPISAVLQLTPDKFVLACGKRLTVHTWDAEKASINTIGFFDSLTHIASLSLVKNFLLLGDISRSVQFVAWREEDHSLNALAKDYEPGAVTASDFIVSDRKLAMLVNDEQGNLQLMQYSKAGGADSDNLGGHRLRCAADFHAGVLSNAFVQHRLDAPAAASVLKQEPQQHQRKPSPRVALTFGTLDGGLSSVIPVEERAFRRLLAIQQLMANALEHTAGANPAALRRFRENGARSVPRGRARSVGKGVLDGPLLWRFASLDRRAQNLLAGAVGTTPDVVVDSLLEIDVSLSQMS